MALIITRSPYNGGEVTVCHLPGEVLEVSCSKKCYEDGRACEFHLAHYPFCEKASELIAEHKERNKEIE